MPNSSCYCFYKLACFRFCKVSNTISRFSGYHSSPDHYRGPRYHHAIFTRHQAIIYFDDGTAAGGLKTNDGQAPRHFFVAGTDQVFYYADARIEGHTIILTCKAVKHPVAVRYAFTNYPITNLQNGAGLPAIPFRTDDWAEGVVNVSK